MRRKKLCKGCREYFRPKESDPENIAHCSPDCAVAIVKGKWAQDAKNKEKALRKAQREQKRQDKTRLNELKPVSHWLKVTQGVFNEYIKKRDDRLGYGCISCGTGADVQYCAGHYRTRGAAGHLRFDERNVHKQCNKRCNLELSGNIPGYRPALINRIGLEAVEALENDNKPRSWTREELEEIRKVYRNKIKELER